MYVLPRTQARAPNSAASDKLGGGCGAGSGFYSASGTISPIYGGQKKKKSVFGDGRSQSMNMQGQDFVGRINTKYGRIILYASGGGALQAESTPAQGCCIRQGKARRTHRLAASQL